MFALLARFFLSARRAALLFLALPLLAAAPSPAQSAPGGPPNAGLSAAPPVSVTAAEVSFDLVVRTKHHQPVLNLEASQFAITDSGILVQPSALRLVKAEPGSQRLVTLVFDQLNPAAAKEARRVAEKILEAVPDSGYTFAVFQVNGRLRLLQSWTDDRRLVDTAVAQATPPALDPPSAEMTPAEKTLIASLNSDALTFSSADRTRGKLLLDALERSQRNLEEHQGTLSLAALQALIGSDQSLSGRKFIFYFSADTTWNRDTRDVVRSIVGVANRAGVTIGIVNTSPFNAAMNSYMEGSLASSILGNTAGTGGATAFGGGSAGTNPGGGGGMNTLASHYVSSYQFGDINSDESPLVAMASGTGGIYISGSRGWKRQLRQLHEDLSAWYQVSWVPPIKDYDGEFRPVMLRPLRKGLVIRARSGYFAVPPEGASEIRPFEMPLLNMLAAPTLPAKVRFHAGVLHLGELPDGNAAELVVQVPVSQLEIHQDANTHISSADAAIVAVIKDSKGQVLQRFGQDFPLHESPETFEANSGQTVTLQRQFSADPGTYSLETAVLDRIGNKAGAQRTTFTIADPAKGPSLSDIALVAGIEPAEEDNQGFFEPMRYRDGLVVPSLDASLPGQTQSLSLFFLLHPIAGSATQPVLHMQIDRDGQRVTEMPMNVAKVSGTGAAVPYLATIQGRGFPPGEYRVKAILAQDGKTASASVSFHVEGTATNAGNPSLTASGPAEEKINSHLVSQAATANSQFVISNPVNPLTPPPNAAVQAMIEAVRERALAWSDTLVNFFCLESTNHFVDATGEDAWKQKATLVELMKYVDHAESRTIMQLNGAPTDVEPDRLQFFHSTGEFGAMFHVVFNPSAHAVFTWRQSALLDGQPLQVIAFKVSRADSAFDLADRENHVQPVGFHGLLYIDPATNSVRRITIDADDIPAKLLIRACSMSVDYAWVSMENHDFLLPVRGAVSLQEAKRRPVLNQFEFSNYHRYGSQVRMITGAQMNQLRK